MRCVAAVLVVTLPAAAQIYGTGRDGPLAPTADVVLDTSANNGVFEFTSIAIPAGVTVRLTGPNPAQLLCRGPVSIDGVLAADGEGSYWVGAVRTGGSAGGPGGYSGGQQYQSGHGPGGGPTDGLYPAVMGGGASHATAGLVGNPFQTPAPTYGSAFPFDLRGGSGGGGPGPMASISDIGPPATGGGGTIVVLAEGPIAVHGTVRARGGDHVWGPEFAWSRPVGTGGTGSGGSILLRSLQCVLVTGRIDATAGVSYLLPGLPNPGPAGAGFIRIDGWSSCGSPTLAGATIAPSPMVTSLPHLQALGPARTGQTLQIRCASAPGDIVGFYYSAATAVTPIPPFGVLELDPSLILFFGQHGVPTMGPDPLAVIDIPLPNLPGLVGLTFHAQVFNAFGAVTGSARLSNRLSVTVVG
jgi:hypothetical protein